MHTMTATIRSLQKYYTHTHILTLMRWDPFVFGQLTQIQIFFYFFQTTSVLGLFLFPDRDNGPK